MREGKEKPLVFVSHDSRDKDEIARPLAQALTSLACPVWFDEFSLQLFLERRLNEDGIRFCFSARDPREGERRLADLVRISKQDVYNYCPRLLDRVGLQWSEGPDQVARKIKRAVDRM